MIPSTDEAQGETHTYAVEENGARVMATKLTPGKMTIFPQASIHTMMNAGMSLHPPFHQHSEPD
jgi:Cupin